MTSIRTHHTGYTVSDLDRSISFYCNLFGFEVIASQEKQGGYLAAVVGYEDAHVRSAHLRLPGDDHIVELFEYLAPTGDVADVEPKNIGASHLCILVDDLSVTYSEMLDAGVRSFVSPPVAIDSGINRGGLGLYLRDPDGITIELFQSSTAPHSGASGARPKGGGTPSDP